MSLFGSEPVQFDFELRCDSNLSESDLPRLQKEIQHNRRKQERLQREQERQRENEEAKEAAEADNVRPADNQNMEALLGRDANNARNGGNNNQRFVNADGFNIPLAMRNYQERTILRGFITLKAYERIDLFWGYFKDVERDFLYSHLFIMSLTLLMMLIILMQSGDETYRGNI